MNNPKRRKNDFSDCPEILKEYLYYSETIRSLSARSVNGYYIDLRTFFRFLKRHKRLVSDDLEFDKIPFSDVDITFVKQITKSDVYEYLHYVVNERDNSQATLARKMSSIKGFFKYCTIKSL